MFRIMQYNITYALKFHSLNSRVDEFQKSLMNSLAAVNKHVIYYACRFIITSRTCEIYYERNVGHAKIKCNLFD